MQVTFLHPTTSEVFNADVDGHTSGQTCLEGLITEGFLERAQSGRPYAMTLSSSGRQILPQTTMAQAGVADGSVISVVQQEQGARI